MAEPALRILLLGSDGQLGSDVQREANQRGIELVAASRVEVDVRDTQSVRKALERARPSWVVNCAAWTNVDGAELEEPAAHAVNATGAGLVARAAKAAGARTLYVSTDYVFDGQKPPPRQGHPTSETAYTERDAPNPIQAYGRTKRAGELATAAADRTNLIVRTSTLYGMAGAKAKRGNIVETFLRMADKGTTIRAVDDQWRCPTSTADLATALLDLTRAGAAGIRHVTNAGACTWFELASEAVRLSGHSARVERAPLREFLAAAPRPANATILGTASDAPTLPSWRDALRRYVTMRGRRAT